MAASTLVMMETRDAGGWLVTYFGITSGLEREAGSQLLEHLRGGAEVWLRNDLDQGGESCTQFRHGEEGYATAVFGHGWSSEWKETDERGVLAAAIGLARLNRATHAGDRGSINRPKARSA
jgi:hypothetical protein